PASSGITSSRELPSEQVRPAGRPVLHEPQPCATGGSGIVYRLNSAPQEGVMNWHVLFASLVLVVPVVAQTPQPQPAVKGDTVTLRACVQQGTHGSIATLRQVEVVTPGGTIESPRVMYWFARYLDVFLRNSCITVEIARTI